MRLAEREAERAARRVKAAQEQEAAKQLSMAQRGMTEEEKEVCMLKASKGKRKRERDLIMGSGKRRQISRVKYGSNF